MKSLYMQRNVTAAYVHIHIQYCCRSLRDNMHYKSLSSANMMILQTANVCVHNVSNGAYH